MPVAHGLGDVHEPSGRYDAHDRAASRTLALGNHYLNLNLTPSSRGDPARQVSETARATAQHHYSVCRTLVG